jgi:hypothetical protein
MRRHKVMYQGRDREEHDSRAERCNDETEDDQRARPLDASAPSLDASRRARGRRREARRRGARGRAERTACA